MSKSTKPKSLIEMSRAQKTNDVENRLKEYCNVAKQLGASDAKIIKSDQIIIEHRVAAKCAIPKCDAYGNCGNCPPFVPSPEEMKKILREYEYAIFIRLILPPQELTSVVGTSEAKTDPRKIFQIISGVESQAFYDGYYLAMGFAGGSCKRALCKGAACNAIIPGGSCRHALKSRPAMEAVGMNAFKIAVNMGWDIYPMGKATRPEDVVCFVKRTTHVYKFIGRYLFHMGK